MWLAIQLLLPVAILFAVAILLLVKAMNRNWKSFLWIIAGSTALALLTVWMFTPGNPPLRRFDPNTLADWNLNRSTDEPALSRGMSRDEVLKVMGCPPGQYGNPEYVSTPVAEMPHPMQRPPFADLPADASHQVWEDDLVIIDCAFDGEQRLLEWNHRSKHARSRGSLSLIRLQSWLGLL